jgi:hypothetical protein
VIENNIIEDTFGYGWVTTRAIGTSAIYMSGSLATIKGNTIINTRNRGITANTNSRITENTISTRSLCTNSSAMIVGSNSRMDHNTITARGQFPMSTEVGTDNNGAIPHVPSNDVHDIEIDNNTMDLETTQLGGEYGSQTYPGPSTWKNTGVWAVGIRSTTGMHDLLIHDNNITVRSSYNFQGTYSPTGQPVTIGSTSKGIMLGLRWNDESMKVYNNTVTALDNDGTGAASGISCTANGDNRWYYNGPWPHTLSADFHPDLQIFNNTVTSNNRNLVLGDDYGVCDGFPLVRGNTFIKTGNFSSYRTIGSGAVNVDYGRLGTGILLSNKYQNGAAEDNLGFDWGSAPSGQRPGDKRIIFGRLMSATVKDISGIPLPNIRATVNLGANSLFGVQLTTASDSNGVAPLYVYDYELNNGTTTPRSATPIRVDFKPHTVSLYDTSISQDLFTSTADNSAGAWDALNSSGMYTLTDANGSLEINTDESTGDVIAPSAPSGLSVM